MDDLIKTGVWHLTPAETEHVFRLLDEDSPEHAEHAKNLRKLFERGEELRWRA